ncbi:MAG: ABC transporter permease [Sedimentisphaerales bacterium]|nr:ABC transporter permease [Sedimentisphaerales bacterium]
MSRIWAISRNLIKEFLRRRALVIFYILISSSYTFLFAWWIHNNEGQADEKIQTFLSYSLSLTAVMLSLLTFFFSIATISRDIKRKEIFTVLTKPLSRGKYLAGKFLGMAVLNLVLLVSTTGVILGFAYLLKYTEPQSDYERAKLDELVFVARQGVQPTNLDMPDIKSEVEKKVNDKMAELIRSDPQIYQGNPQAVDAMRFNLTKDYTNELTMRYRTAPTDGTILWHFTGIKPKDHANKSVILRYKQEPYPQPPDDHVVNEWMIGPRNPLDFGGKGLRTDKQIVRTFHELPIPVSEVSEEGELYVLYHNPAINRATIVFPTDNGMQALYVAGGFMGNFIRTVTIIYLHLLFSSCLGLAMGAWLSFPVAVLLVLVVYVLGLCSTFVDSALTWAAGETLRTTMNFILKIFPKYSLYDPVPKIDKGLIVPYGMLLSCLGYMVLIKGGLVSLFGYVVFKFRELARVIA